MPPARETGSVQWVRPQQLCEVSYAQMTRGGIIRQAVFHGLREDKPAREVTGERPAGASRAATAGVRISHPQRLIDPSIQASKLELAEFHARYADLLLRDLRERPVSLVRGPDGIGGELFFQKHAARLKIPGIVQLDPALDPGHPPLLQIRSAEALVGAVQMGSIEFHTWNASLANLERPDRFVLDLDPDPAQPSAQMQLGDLSLNLTRGVAQIDGQEISLTLSESRILEALLRQPGEPLDKQALAQLALGRKLTLYDRSLDMHVSNLRKKLGSYPDGSPRILALRGRGYYYSH